MDNVLQTHLALGSVSKWLHGRRSTLVIIWSYIWRCLSEHFQGKCLITFPACLLGDQHRASHGKGSLKGFISTEIFYNWGIKLNQCFSEISSPFSSGNFNCHVRFQMILLMLRAVEMQVWPWARNISFTHCWLHQTSQPTLPLHTLQPEHSDLFRILTNSSMLWKVNTIWAHDRKTVVK